MGPNIGLVLLLFVLGGLLLAGAAVLARVRRDTTSYSETLNNPIIPVNLADNDNAVLVAQGRGQLVFANTKARQWFNMNGGTPNLEVMAQAAQPANTFLELFGKEGHASFQVGPRRLEATSHFIPGQSNGQMVVVMRELNPIGSGKDIFDPLQAMNVVGEISQTISSNLGLDETLDAILASISNVISFDAGEITLWDSSQRVLRPRGKRGDIQYFETFAHTDGVYHLDDSFSGWLARYRQPLLVVDIALRPDVKPKVKDYPFQSFVGLPLSVGSRFIGTLELGNRQRNAFDHEDIALLQAVAGQAAIAIENARLRQSQSERAAEISGLQEIATSINALRDYHQLYSQVTNRIASLMNVDMCGILLYKEEEDALIGQLPFTNVPDSIAQIYRIPIQEGSQIYQLFQTADWWFTNSVRTDETVRMLGLNGLAEAVGARTTGLVPLTIHDRRAGVIQVSNKRDGTGFTENDMRLLTVFGSQAAIVIENARLYIEEQRRTEELGGLQQISQAIGVVRDTEQLFGELTSRVAMLMHVEISGILLYETEEEHLVAQQPFYGLSPEQVAGYTLAVKDTPLAELQNERTYWMSNLTSAEPALGFDKQGPLLQLIPLQQVLFATLRVGGRYLGVLQIANKTSDQMSPNFTAEDAHILAVYAGQVAIIIDNANLYQRMQERVNASERLLRITELLSQAVDIDELIVPLNREIAQLFNADVIMIGMLDDRTGQLVIYPMWMYGLPQITQAIQIDVYATDYQSSPLFGKRPVLFKDIRTDGSLLPVYRGIAERAGILSMVQAPLLLKERGIGELILAYRDENKQFTDDDLTLIKSITSQISSTIDRIQLSRETDADLRVRIQQLDALTRVGTELNLTFQLERIMEVIRQEALRVTEVQNSMVVLLKPSTEWEAPDMPVVEQRFGDPGGLEASHLTSIERAVLRSRQLVWVTDYFTVTSSRLLSPEPTGTRCAVATPIFYGEEPVGIIHIYDSRPESITESDCEFIRALANQAATAVSNALHYREQLARSDLLRQRADQLNYIFELSSIVRSEENLEGILTAISQGIADAIGFNYVLISTADHDKQIMRRVGQAGLALSTFEELKRVSPSIQSIVQLLDDRYKISNSYFLPSEQKEQWGAYVPTLSLMSEPTLKGPQAWLPNDMLLVPLRDSQGNLSGLVSVDDPRNGRRPILQTVEALEIFANQAALAIENYRLLQAYEQEAERTRLERDRLERLHLVATEIQRAADVPTRLKVVADGIVAAGWRRVAITLRDNNLDPHETITVGYTPEEEQQFFKHLLPGTLWSQRLADPEFRRNRVGQAYYIQHNDAWVTEGKLIAASTNPSIAAEKVAVDEWHPLDSVYLPLYGLDNSRLIGIITMDSPSDNKAPTEASMRPIELFANQAASAIENTRLYEASSRSADQESRINEIMEAVAATLDLDEIIRGITEGLHDVIPFTRMNFLLMDEEQSMFRVRQVVIDPRGKISVKQGDPIMMENSAAGEVVRDPVTRFYHIKDGQGKHFHDLSHWRQQGERTTMLIPMLAGGRVTGVLHMGSELENAFGFEEQTSLITRMANLAAIAIENSNLFQQTLEREKFSSAIGKIGQSVTSMLDIKDVLHVLVTEVRQNLNVNGAYVWISDGLGTLYGIDADGLDAGAIHSMKVPLSGRSLEAEIVRTNAPLTASDLHKPNTRWQAVMPASTKVYSLLGVPLSREDRAIGVLMLAITDLNRRFVNSDVERAISFASQASLAMDNVRLYQDIQQRAQQLAQLTELSGELASTLEPEEVIKLVLERLGAILPYDRVTLWLRKDKKLVIRAARGFDDNAALIGVEAEIEDSALFNDLASRGRTLNIPDITQDERFPFSDASPTRSWLGISLVPRSNLAGLLVLEKSEIAFYTSTMEQIALTFANQAAVSLENARLFQEVTQTAQENTRLYRETATRATVLDQQARRLALLNQVSTALTQSPDIENIFDVTLREMTRVLNADHSYGLLLDANSFRGHTIFEYPRGDMPPTVNDVHLVQEGSPLLAEVKRTMSSLAIRDVTIDPRTEFIREELAKRAVLSVAVIPLIIGGNMIGVMAFESFYEARDFSADQIEVAQTVASQSAIAVQNANLFEQSLIRTRELETLFDATQATTASLNLQDVLNNTTQQMMYALQADSSQISLWDPMESVLIVQADAELYPTGREVDAFGKTYDLKDYPTRLRALQSMQVLLMRRSDTNLGRAETRLMQQRNAHSRMLLPMIVQEQPIGLIEVETQQDNREFTIQDIRLARTLASQAAVAIDNARLNTETTTMLSDLLVINDLATALAGAIEFEQIADIVRQQLPDLVNAPILLMAMLSEDQLMVNYPVAIQQGKDLYLEPHPISDDETSYFIKAQAIHQFNGKQALADIAEQGIQLKFTQPASLLGVPMMAGNDVIGALIIAHEQDPRAFSEDKARLLGIIAAQIAVSIQNARLFSRTRQFTAELEQAVKLRTEELQEERDRIQLLLHITTDLASSLDIELVLNRTLQMMAESIGADMGAILGIDTMSDNMMYQARFNMNTNGDSNEASFSQHDSLTGYVIQTQQSVVVEDLDSDPRWVTHPEFTQPPRSAILSLLEANEDILGVIMLYSSQPNRFTNSHLRLIAAATNQVANAMNNAELYGLIREQADRLSIMVRREQVESTKNLSIVESIADGVMVADPTGNITQFNSAAERILGLPRRNVIGHHITELTGLYTSSGGQSWAQELQRWIGDPTALQAGENFSGQVEFENGKVVQIILSPVTMGDQFLGTVSVIRDITREIEVDRMKSEFVATVSHELRTPMTSIKGYADLLLLGAAGSINDGQHRFLSTIKTNADRLSVLVNELLDISRVDRGSVKLNFQAIDPNELLEAVDQHLRNRLAEEGKLLEVETRITTTLSPVHADFDKMLQVLNNLADNAFNYTQTGGHVTLSAEPDVNSVVFKIQDTGVGIAKDKQDRIWTRFFRDEEQPLVMETSGTGLGLSIVQEYVKMHNGDIWLDSEVGKGTTFYVRIPTSVTNK